MLRRLAWLGLEVKYLEPARAFYMDALELSQRDPHDASRKPSGDDDSKSPAGTASSTSEADQSLALAAGETDLMLRRPTSLPRGGLHTHFAFSIPHTEYDDWWNALEPDFALEEFVFGHAKSLYLYDPDGNCVELGQQNVEGPGIDGIFEVVLEVASLERAESFYAALGFETVDRGANRKRVRMAGPMALELWEPHLGIADARGGVHVDLGFETSELEAVREAIEDRVCSLEKLDDDTIRVRDPDGHVLTFVELE